MSVTEEDTASVGPEQWSGRVCSVAGCGRKHYGNGFCRSHHARWRRHGDPGADVPFELKTMGGVSYWSIHQRLKTERGPGTAHRCAQCPAPAVVWSYDGTDPAERTDPTRGYRYSLDPARYRPRCRSCHRRATTSTRRPQPRSQPVVDVERAARLYLAGASAGGIGALLGASRTAVYTALRAQGVPIRPRGTRAPISSTALNAIEPREPDHEATTSQNLSNNTDQHS